MRSILRTGSVALVTVSTILIGAHEVNAKAAVYSYIANSDATWGVLNVTSGALTACGKSSQYLQGLGVGPTGTIYATTIAPPAGSMLWTVNPSNGALTAIAVPGYPLAAIGSTSNGQLYGLDDSFVLYKVNSVTGALKKVGPTGLPSNNPWSFSSGGRQLFMTVNNVLYQINTSTGMPTQVGGGPTVSIYRGADDNCGKVIRH